MCRSYNRQYGTHYLAAMPTNLYGPNDNYDLEGAHVLPALIRKMHEAKTGGLDRVVIWGTGSPRREFLYSDDMADACVMMMNLRDEAVDQVLAEPADIEELPRRSIGLARVEFQRAAKSDYSRHCAGTIGYALVLAASHLAARVTGERACT